MSVYVTAFWLFLYNSQKLNRQKNVHSKKLFIFEALDERHANKGVSSGTSVSID